MTEDSGTCFQCSCPSLIQVGQLWISADESQCVVSSPPHARAQVTPKGTEQTLQLIVPAQSLPEVSVAPRITPWLLIESVQQ